MQDLSADLHLCDQCRARGASSRESLFCGSQLLLGLVVASFKNFEALHYYIIFLSTPVNVGSGRYNVEGKHTAWISGSGEDPSFLG